MTFDTGLRRLACAAVAFITFVLAPARAEKSANTYSTKAILAERHLKSPEISSDRRVTFRLEAPSAQNVVLQFGEWSVASTEMKKKPNGVWEATIGPIEPGIYSYNFSVDGVKAVDLLNPEAKIGTRIYASVVEVNGPAPRIDQSQPVPHGVIHVHQYISSSLHSARQVYVYTPPGYRDSTERFPVLYLRHGGGDTEASWSVDGRANIILDNLIAAHRAVPMLIVMTNGMTDGSWAGGSSAEGIKALDTELMADVLPLIEQEYRVAADAGHRAIAGLSMGGGQAFIIGLNHLDHFAWIGEFSSGLLADKDLNLESLLPLGMKGGATNYPRLSLLWVGCGDLDPRYRGHLELVENLRSRGIETVWHSSQGGHEWNVWREQLAAFLPKLFQKQ